MPDELQSSDFSQIRIENLVAESGYDFEPNDIFPYDIGYDQNGAIDFQKGCYVGQEVVSRMKHRGTARKRPVIVEFPADFVLNDPTIVANNKTIGSLGSCHGSKALGIVRLDRLQSALDVGVEIKISDQIVTINSKVWANEIGNTDYAGSDDWALQTSKPEPGRECYQDGD